METDNNNQAIIDVARAGVPHGTLESNSRFQRVLVHGFGNHASRIETVDVEPGLGAPLRRRGDVVVFDAASFNIILKDNAAAGDISIYLDRNPTKPAIVAVLNGNGSTGPGWGDFRAAIQFRPTPQWVKWTGIDGQMMPQAKFAEFIEDNLEDIAEPAGATMLEIATYLEATRTTSFKSGLRLSNGAIQLQNLEDVDAKVGPGKIDVPEMITLGLRPLQGCASYRIPARFRYRITDGKLTLGIKLQRIEDLMTTLLDDVVAKIERGANISVIEGLAPNPTK